LPMRAAAAPCGSRSFFRDFSDRLRTQDDALLISNNPELRVLSTCALDACVCRIPACACICSRLASTDQFGRMHVQFACVARDRQDRTGQRTQMPWTHRYGRIVPNNLPLSLSFSLSLALSLARAPLILAEALTGAAGIIGKIEALMSCHVLQHLHHLLQHIARSLQGIAEI